VDLAANAESLGARVLRVKTRHELDAALAEVKRATETVVIHIPVDRYEGVDAGGAWWDVATAEIADSKPARDAYERHVVAKRRQRWHV